jgi:signal transduction histidine kinase
LLRKKAISQNPELLTLLDKITDNSEETVTLMRDTVWAINPSNDSTAKLIEKMHSFSAEILSAKGISFDFECLIDTTKDVFSMEQRRNLYLIYKEAINNIAKHAEATKASCLIKTEHDLILIVIRDNGRGFDLNETFEGNGLKNFKMRSQGEELEVKVRSSPGSGSEIRIEIAV